MADWLGKGLRGLIRLYQWVISPWLAPRCRFLPTCSEYALEAITLHGPWQGGWLALRRVARCHPWGGSGVDEVPAPRRHCPGHSPDSNPSQSD